MVVEKQIKYLILLQVSAMVHLPTASANFMCGYSDYVQWENSTSYDYRELGYNTIKTLTIAPGQTCLFVLDERTNEKVYFADQNDPNALSGKFGKYMKLEWDLYTIQDGDCLYHESGVGGLDGIFFDYDDLYTGREGTFCRYLIYFTSANCGTSCTDEER